MAACCGPAAGQVPFADAETVAVNQSHGCAVNAAGGVKCWGRNNNGQLGDNSTTDRLTAVDVNGLTSGIAAITAGLRHTCALTEAGGVKCWGYNGNGQLGNNSNSQRLTAVDVSGLESGVQAIAAGLEHTCALTDVGGVKCWGGNAYGQLGDNSTMSRLTAVDVSGLTSGVVAIAAGREHTCALNSVGGIKCWGRNDSAQLGDNSTTQRLTPVDVAGLASGIAAVAAGDGHTCALTDAGGVKCWGGNASGQLGDGSTTFRLVPVDAVGLASGVAALTAGMAHSCAITDAGDALCWGLNSSGQLGDNSTTQRLAAVDVIGLTNGTTAIAAAGLHTCAVTDTGAVKCWGYNANGQLGDNSDTRRASPADVLGLASGVATVAAGAFHTCAITDAGGLKCWGWNDHGQLGDSTTMGRLSAVEVVGLANGVTAVAAGEMHTCALTDAGGIKCWGNNDHGQLGDNTITQRTTPGDVAGLGSGVTAVTAGARHTCALAGGGVKCWGRNDNGQLGDGSTTQRLTAVDVTGLTSGVLAIAAGEAHTCAITGTGGVKCWGQNQRGQLGDDSTTQRLTAVDAIGLASGAHALTAGHNHTCAITDAGGAKCWGYNLVGQVGDGSTADRHAAVDVSGLASGVSAIAAGGLHTCALTDAGATKCWGHNIYWQLGDSSSARQLAPADVMGLPAGSAAIAAGKYHNCVLTGLGGLKCWGDKQVGQLGDGTGGYRPFPADALQFATFPAAPAGVAALAGDASASVSFTAPADDGGSPVTGFIATSAPGGLTSSDCTSSPCTVAGLTNGQSYTFTIAASNAVGTGAESAPSNSVTPKGSQAIVFVALDDQVLGAPPLALEATGGSSGNPVTFASLTEAVCTTSGTHGASVTLVAAGECTLRASQAGSASHAAAADVDRSFQVAPAGASLALVAAPETVVAGNLVLLTATLSGVAPSGSIAFIAGGQALPGCEAQALADTGSGPAAECVASELPEGEYAITAVYPGDANNTAAASPVRLLRVLRGDAIDLAVDIARVQPEGASLPEALAASGGTLASYRIAVINRGTLPAEGVRLDLLRSAGLQDLLWTCAPPSGSCAPTEGGMPLSTSFTLAVGGTADVVLSGVVDSAAAFIEIVAGARPPAGAPVAFPGDDTRYFYEAAGPDGLLKHGFE